MIVDNVHTVLDKIHKAAAHSGRDVSEITVVGVSKTRSVEEIEQVLDAGITHLGENRVPEAELKIPEVTQKAVWHMIGHLQSNKAKRSATIFDWVDSIDSEKTAQILSDQAVASGKVLQALVQVKVSHEQTKTGINPDGVKALMRSVGNLPGINVRGLMTIGTFGVTEDKTRAEFSMMREMFDQFRSDADIAPMMEILSMGMSDDFVLAIKEGATMVRIGSAIFGTREK